MAQLSAQSIRRLCQPYKKWTLGLVKQIPMIEPFLPVKTIINGMSAGLSSSSYDARIAHDLYIPSKQVALAYTVEFLNMPNNVSAFVIDKSSMARRFISAQNTYVDPSFKGQMVLELVNLGEYPLNLNKGDPVCQFVFNWIDYSTDIPYSGKYQHQTGIQPAIYEK